MIVITKRIKLKLPVLQLATLDLYHTSTLFINESKHFSLRIWRVKFFNFKSMWQQPIECKDLLIPGPMTTCLQMG